jgi:RimJ/RimL family protein N-acetyltransferase
MTAKISPTIELKTPHLMLRPVRLGDEKEIHEYAGDKKITMMFWLPNDSFEETCEITRETWEEMKKKANN